MLQLSRGGSIPITTASTAATAPSEEVALCVVVVLIIILRSIYWYIVYSTAVAAAIATTAWNHTHSFMERSKANKNKNHWLKEESEWPMPKNSFTAEKCQLRPDSCWYIRHSSTAEKTATIDRQDRQTQTNRQTRKPVPSNNSSNPKHPFGWFTPAAAAASSRVSSVRRLAQSSRLQTDTLGFQPTRLLTSLTVHLIARLSADALRYWLTDGYVRLTIDAPDTDRHTDAIGLKTNTNRTRTPWTSLVSMFPPTGELD